VISIIIGASCFGGFIHCIMTNLSALLIVFSLQELVQSIECSFSLKFGN